MAFEPDRVIVDNTPNRWLRLSKVVGDAIDEYQQNTRLQQQHNETVKAQVLAAFLHNPSAETYATVHAAFPNMDLGKFQESPEQQFQGKFYGNLNNTYDPTKPLNVDPIAAGMVNPKLAEAKPFMEAASQRYTYSRPNDLPPQVATAQQTTDKLIPTGNENVVNAQNAPVKIAEAANQNAQATSHSADAAFTQGPKTTLTKAETANQSAQASEHSAKARAASMFLPDLDTGAPNAAVQNELSIMREGIKKGISIDLLKKRITDKNLSAAVSAELTKPQNQDIATALPPLTTKGQNALAEIDPAEKNVDEIIKALQPFKDDNVHGLRWAHLKYTLGFGSDPSTIESKVSQFNLAGIEAQMPFASKSRAYQYIQDIGKHRFHTEKDTFETMYEKALNIKDNFTKMRDAVSKYERVGATDAGVTVAPKSGVIVYDNNGNRVQ